MYQNSLFKCIAKLVHVAYCGTTIYQALLKNGTRQLKLKVIYNIIT